MNPRITYLVLVAALSAAVLSGCSGDDEQPRRAAARETTATAAGKAVPFELYTHCGIDDVRIGPTWFEAVRPLSGGSGNPPAGWDNPTQRGTMTLVSPTAAVFTDAAGHEVRFRARPGATAPKRVCE
ncbi:hypothetical protein ACIP98_13110 [Streptomyces sp. NPDC088354]|uniref:hypothetical protein n=1 Tax=unclassified Streptomyces TaxID=2593676 RepID=UPI0029A6D555|nr:hypothetical protein [Streptomyces sp. MI02-7b]MDX3072753.1 hypothetical protein [Streptomyces sp. MI02-7b]